MRDPTTVSTPRYPNPPVINFELGGSQPIFRVPSWLWTQKLRKLLHILLYSNPSSRIKWMLLGCSFPDGLDGYDSSRYELWSIRMSLRANSYHEIVANQPQTRMVVTNWLTAILVTGSTHFFTPKSCHEDRAFVHIELSEGFSVCLAQH